jgi:hypothetical protein
MRIHVIKGLLVGLFIVGIGVALDAQRQRASPHETAKATVDGATIAIDYGRPYMKGRKIFGGLVPFGQVWRTGADEATTLTTDKGLVFGSLAVPAGKYTLFTIPGEKEWTLVINKQIGQWGTQYDQAQDLGRVTIPVGATAAPVEQLTIKIGDTTSGGELHFEWESTRAVATFAVK